MLHRDIIIKYLGKKVKEAGMKTVECVAWSKKYCEERGYPIGYFGGSAIKGWEMGFPFDDTWQRVIYKPGLYPKQGDQVFWSEGRCTNGHVAVANNHCNKEILRCTDGNGTGHQDPITARFYNYSHVLGWFTKVGKK